MITHEVIQEAVRRARWDPDQQPLRAVLDQFSNRDSSPQCLFMLAAGSLRWVWQEMFVEQQAVAITIRMLERMAARPQGHEIVNALCMNIAHVFGLDVVNSKKAKDVIVSWARANRTIVRS